MPSWSMVVEELEVDVDPDQMAGYLEADRLVWTAFLSKQTGFVRKDVLRPVDRPGVIVLQIWWTSFEAWHGVTEATCIEIDRQMGSWRRPVRCRAFEVLSSQ